VFGDWCGKTHQNRALDSSFFKATMPEQLTKHPEATLQILQSGGAQCGTGAPPQTLKDCPPQRLCTLPGGEICVYGLPQAARMTEISATDWRAVIGQADAAASPPTTGPAMALASGIGLVLIGVAIGYYLRRP
jgi:hypothetical protein